MKNFPVLVIFLTFFTALHYAQGLAVMSIDIGSEWMKVAIVSPGVPMEIALNRESQRKTPVAVSFRDGERVFGDPAVTIGVRFPDKAYMYLLDILGKRIDNPLVDLYKKRFPYYNIVATQDRSSVMFKHPEGFEFTVEELVAMILKQAQDIAQKTTGQPIKDAVITVPAFFNQAERRAMLQAAKLSGLNVLQLINSNTAVALNYGVFRRRDFNETPTNILFYDMGAGSTVATIATYQLMKSKETGEINPQLTIKGVGFDRTLGGLEMQLRLRNHLAKVFSDSKKTDMNVFESHRAMSKLLKEAGRVKKVLSANNEHTAQVESLLDDKDFKCPVTRVQFEELCANIFERVTKPIEVALKSANMDLINIDQVILSGSGARVPMVQQKLLEYIHKSELGKSLNTDESAALGAAYQAAHLSKGFKVKTFLIRDANIYPIQVDFQREFELEDKTMGIKTVKRVLFSRNNGIPLKKIMTFNRHVKDFNFYVNYGELGFLTDFELQALGSTNITEINLTGLEAAIQKNMGPKTEYKGVKAHFRMDDSGILNMDEVEAVFEKEELVTNEFTEFKSALSQLGDTIGRLFTGTVDEPGATEEPKLAPGQETNGTTQSENASAVNETKKAPAAKNETKVEPKLLMVKEPLTSSIEFHDLVDLTEEVATQSLKKLVDLDEHDRARLAKAKVKNSLESFIVETKHKLYTDEYEKATTQEEMETIMKSLTEVGNWLEYESDGATTEVFKGKLAELRALAADLFERVNEHRNRPEAVKSLNDMINVSQVFLNDARNVSEDDQIFTQVELTTLEKLITETRNWAKESITEQKALPMNVAPKLTLKLIEEKMNNLGREVKYLLNKARFAQPKKKKTVEKPANESTANTTEKEKEKVIELEEALNDSTSQTMDIPDAKIEQPETELEEPINDNTSQTKDIPDAKIDQPEAVATDTTTPNPSKSKPVSEGDPHLEL